MLNNTPTIPSSNMCRSWQNIGTIATVGFNIRFFFKAGSTFQQDGQVLKLKCAKCRLPFGSTSSHVSVHPSYDPAPNKELNPDCLRACSGNNLLISSGGAFASSCLKLNSGGNGRPFGSLACGSRNSSKNEWAHASRALHRRFGEYWRRRETRSIASGGILLWKILCHGHAFIWGNLNSV